MANWKAGPKPSVISPSEVPLIIVVPTAALVEALVRSKVATPPATFPCTNKSLEASGVTPIPILVEEATPKLGVIRVGVF